jgi:6-bladed beta-propeller
MQRMNRIGIAVMLLMMIATVALADWQGETATVDGATIVNNPETPAFGDVRQELRELWRRGGESDEEIFFGTIAEFLHDEDGNLFLLDGQLSEIQVFDPEGELMRTVGRQGEGPGEFQNGADMFWAPGGDIGVAQAWPGKIVMVTPEGDPGSTFALPYRDGGGWQSVTRGAGFEETMILAGTAWTREDGKQMQFNYLKAYDAGGNELATYQETSRETSFGDYEFIEEEYVDFQRRWAVAPDGRVAAALSFEDYRIHVWNADGTVDRIIERLDYQAVKRTKAEKDRFQTMYDAFTQWNRGSTFRVAENHQAVAQIFFREDGTLWIQSSTHRWRAAEDLFTSFDVYDDQGRYLRRVDLAADADAVEDGLYFAGDRAYVVTDLYNAIMASIGGDSEDAAMDAEPVTVISFEFPAQVAGNGGAIDSFPSSK